MSKKTITVISLIVIVIGIGMILDYYPKEEPTPSPPEDEIISFLKELEQETRIDFSEIKEVDFEWAVKGELPGQEIEIKGKGFEVERISTEQYRDLESLFADKGFEVDVYNLAAGTVSGLTGYRKDKMACLLIAGATGYKEATGQWLPPEPDKKDVEVKCGQTEFSLEPEVSKEEAIKKLFAEKYNKKLAEITINITQKTENHLRGGVVLAPGGIGEGGIFLAAKVDGYWKLAFDGNGSISCEQMGKYNFPEEMIEDCVETQTIKTEKDDKFFIVLESNPTTGYQWETDFDDAFLQLTDREYIPTSPELIGSGGLEKFNFLALKSGETEITFSYLRSWEKGIPPLEERVYKIIIK